MKVQCPSCKARYNIDISKIPELPPQGIHTTCPKCKAQIPIRVEDEPEKVTPQDTTIIPCPQCGHVNVATTTCVSCGAIFSEDDQSKLAISIQLDD